MFKKIFIFSFLFLLSSVEIFTQTCAAPSAGLSNFWTGDNSANDFVGTNHGTLQNGAGYTLNARVGEAFNLDGVDDFVNVASPISLGSTFTVELWIYPTMAGGYRHIVSNGYTSANFGALYFVNDRLEYWQGGTTRATTPATSVPLNQWTHIALVYDGSIAQLYLNGAASGANTGVHPENFNNPLRFGYAVVQESGNFQGRLDEISLYNTALLPGDIQAIFNAGSKGKCVAPAVVVGDASIFEGGSGMTNLNFAVSSIRASAAAQVDYATADGTATQPTDYLSASGTTSVPATGVATVTILVNGDTTDEPHETLFLNLSNPVGAFIADAQALGTILNDDQPTAASVSVGGRVLAEKNTGISRAVVSLTDASGATRYAISNSFGYYRFDEIPVGETYVFAVRHKRYQFAPQVVTVNEDLTELNFTALN